MEVAIIPRLFLRRLLHDSASQLHANILFSSVLVLAMLVLCQNQFQQISSIPHFCVFQKTMNVPCPGCGVTRSFFSIVEGNVMLAWQFNPVGLWLFLFFIIQIPLRIVALKFKQTSDTVARFSKAASWVVICIMSLVWIVRVTQ